MQPLLRLIREAHRRSLWQVLSVYMVGSWIALQVVQAVTQTAGLPDWTPGFAFVLLVIGLPVVLATAFVQEGAPRSPTTPPVDVAAPSAPAPLAAGTGSLDLPSTRPKLLQRTFTWRRAVLGGIGAFVLLFVAVGGYFGMRFLGVGPVASLAAQGLMEDGSRVLLADFRNATSDSLLGSVVTEAMRIDLARSDAFTLVERPRVDEVLVRMQRNRGEKLTADLAREVAIRDGIQAVLEGDVGAAGSGYILSATIRSPEDGTALATFRRTARSPDEVIDAIDGLSQDVREKTGESLRSIKQGTPLQNVTTTSLEALRKFTEGDRLTATGDERGGLALLEEAVALDSTFAMAWRKIAVIVANRNLGREREVRALEALYRHRDRLTEGERYLAEAAYHNGITGDLDAIAQAYQNVLRIDPQSPQGLNNLANVHSARGELPQAEDLLRRAVGGPGVSNTAFYNLVRNLLQQGKLEDARAVQTDFASRYPNDAAVHDTRFWLETMAGDFTAATEAVRTRAALPGVLPTWLVSGDNQLALLELLRGRRGEFERLARSAARRAGREGGAAYEVETRINTIHALTTSGDIARAKELLTDLERSGLFEAAPREERPWVFMAYVQLGAGNDAGALRVIERWKAEMPENRIRPSDRADMAFYETWARAASPSDMLQALEVVRRESPCVRCYRLEEAEWQAAEGRVDEARAVLRDLLALPVSFFTEAMASRIRATERLGELAEQAGDKAEAADAYRRLVETWKDADGAGQPRLRRAQARLAALGT